MTTRYILQWWRTGPSGFGWLTYNRDSLQFLSFDFNDLVTNIEKIAKRAQKPSPYLFETADEAWQAADALYKLNTGPFRKFNEVFRVVGLSLPESTL